ncbi:MAG: ParB/RepB/Spo0J family partition protein [Candidatus Omnitrophica bacterium]|nr:ParB/RepB/Spo0J family partition protein [Candidatus Omnitrophota bacterium]
MEKRLALGKGLSALIPEKSAQSPSSEESSVPLQGVAYLKTNLILDNSLQPRRTYDDHKLNELKESIKEKGIIQPIVVREKGGRYEVVAGERRLRAARALGLEEIPVIIKQVDDREALVLALVENIQREELNPIEEALAFRQLIEEFGFSQAIVAQSVGKDHSTINNVLRLLKLPLTIQQSLIDGNLSMGHARALLSIENPQEQEQLFRLVISKGLSVREVENRVKAIVQKAAPQKIRVKQKSHEYVFLEEEMQRSLGTKVRIEPHKKRGKIVIEYYSPEDLERILQLIKR